MQIILFGQELDPHVIAVSNALKANSANFVIVDTVLQHPSTTLSVDFIQEHPKVMIHCGNQDLNAEDVCSAWWRIKLPMTPKPATLESETIEDFRRREWLHTLTPMEEWLANCRWVNRPSQQRRANHKMIQLGLAHQHGLKIPRTLVSNNPSTVAKFVKSCGGNAIYKPLTAYYEIHSGKITFTTAITNDYVAAKSAGIQQCPGIYQENIQKREEIRVTVVGSQIFTVKINSQGCKGAEQDWREQIEAVEYCNGSLPKEIERQLLALHQDLGLDYCAYDFIVAVDGEHIFLEANPAGQWLWLEEKLDLPISQSIASLLAKRN